VACGSPEDDSVAPVVEGPAEFVGLASCESCHEPETELWRDSHHDLAMQEATDETVLGDFDGARFTYAGTTSTFSRRGDAFVVETDGPDGELTEYEIAYTFGVEPLQQYLIAFPGGSYQALNVVWDTRPAAEGGQRWYHLYPDEAVDYRDPFHWTGPYQNWNHVCAECHSTELRKRYDASAQRFDTTWSEIDVSCEACHGPGSRHVEWAEAAERGEPVEMPRRGLVFELADRSGGEWILDPEKGIAERSVPRDSGQQVESCARCHARRTLLTEDYGYGRMFLDTHRPALLEEALYHADGQILDEVYVWGSFVQSKMYAAGVACSDCHDPHSLTVPSPDGVCAQCHDAGRFALPEHHFHEMGTRGASCVECHMASRDYMVVDGRRDHSFRVPRPDLTLSLGTPNACGDCHLDRSPEWVAEAFAKWYPGEREAHYGEAIALGRRGGPGAAAALEQLAADPAQPAMVRATALLELGHQVRPASLAAIEGALADADALVRLGAVRALEGLDPLTRWRLGAPLSADPIRAVRLEAARVLADVPREMQGGPHLADYESVVAELESFLEMDADRAQAQLLLGTLAAREGRLAEAEGAFRRAIELDRTYSPAYANLADLLRAQNRDTEGAGVLLEGVEQAADPSGLHHAYGLLLVRQGRAADALPELERAADLRPDVARYGYVLAVALESAGEGDRALELLAEVHARHPGDVDVLSALVAYHRARGEEEAAAAYEGKLESLMSAAPGS
jgi:tetratricopeptide (TPR) repeat protein